MKLSQLSDIRGNACFFKPYSKPLSANPNPTESDVPNLFWYRDQFHGRHCFHGWVVGLGVGWSLGDNTSYGKQQMKLCLPAPHRLLCDQVSTRLWTWPGSWGPLYRIAPFNWDGSWSPMMHERLLGNKWVPGGLYIWNMNTSELYFSHFLSSDYFISL